MRIHRIVPLVVGLAVPSCDDSSGPREDGTLVVSTATAGTAPDGDGYLLTIDDLSSVTLDPTDTARIETPSGRHVLRLAGVAEHCVVAPGTLLEVEVLPRSTSFAAFEVTCQATGVRTTVVTTGTDRDVDGYRLVVDGTDRGVAPTNGTVLTRLGAGRRTIVLQGLASNCRVDGQDSHTVTIEEAEVVPIEFTVVCNATTGVIGVLLAAGSEPGEYAAVVDGRTTVPFGEDRPGYAVVPPGAHEVSLTAPDHCTAGNPSQSVTVTAGSPVRDTAEVAFAVRCDPTRLRISAPTTRPDPDLLYSVWICDTGWYCYYNGPSLLGTLAPNGTLVAVAVPGLSYYLELRDVPRNCSVQVPNPTAAVMPIPGDTVDVEFPVAC